MMFEKLKKRKAIKLLRKADKMLTGHWTRSRMVSRNIDGEYTFCAIGAVCVADTGNVDNLFNIEYSEAYTIATTELEKVVKEITEGDTASIVWYNDRVAESENDIHKVFKAAIKNLEGK